MYVNFLILEIWNDFPLYLLALLQQTNKGALSCHNNLRSLMITDERCFYRILALEKISLGT